MNAVLTAVLTALAFSGSPPVFHPSEVRVFTHGENRITVLRAEVALPDGNWAVLPAPGPLHDPILEVDATGLESLRGTRSRRVLINRQTRKAAQHLHTIRWHLQQLADPTRRPPNTSGESLRERVETMLNSSPWPEETVEGPFFFRIPGVTTPAQWTSERVPLVLELRPYLDDGRHHVLYTNGAVERVEPDLELLERHGLTLAPVVPASRLEVTDRLLKHAIYAIVRADAKTSSSTIRLRSGDEEIAIEIDLKSALPGDSQLVKRWALARSRHWSRFASLAPSSALSVWVSRQGSIHGEPSTTGQPRARDRGRSTTIFGVLGGRAAIRETLQMQALDGTGVDSSGDARVSVDSIAGVEVKSHPFEEMLGGRPGGRLAIADHVPVDRFFVYFAKPAALAAYLGGGSDFLLETSRALSGSSLDHDLKQKYLDRLGMNSEWLELLLKSGAVEEIAMVFPDIFFIDGTEVSAILRIPQIEQLKPLLALIGVRGLDAEEGSGIVEKRLTGTRRTFWATRGDLLFVSSHRAELKRILSVGEGEGVDSLGRSAEFRYMLTKLALRDSTRAFAYLSDPFIRRLVGPRVKIAQRRRLLARADLESLTAGALLYRAEGREGQPTIESLAALGHVPESLARRGYRLDENLVAHSDTFGTPSDLTSLLDVDVERVTPEEHQAYKAYVTAYTRFWRQFFDPIAIRLDEPERGELELEVFILPLLDSSIYRAVRQVLPEAGTGAPLRVPHFEPEPVLMLSANVADEAWTGMADNFVRFYEEFGLPLELIDELGPSFHLAILDGDPVLNLGSGDVLGSFGMSMRRGWFGDEEMFFIPAVLSAFTRPCKVLIELRDSERVSRLLRETSLHRPMRARWDFGYDLTRLGDRDEWILSIDFFGFARLRLGVEVRDGFLIFSNIPWTGHSEFRGRRGGHLDSVLLQVTPGAGTLQLPGLFTAAMEKEREAAYRSAAHLLPLMLAGSGDIESARAWHRSLFGFTPDHPGGGSFTWEDGMVVSDRFGTIRDQRQPAYEAGDREFGWLRRVHGVRLSLQLEDGGLRTRARWSLREPGQAASLLPSRRSESRVRGSSQPPEPVHEAREDRP